MLFQEQKQNFTLCLLLLFKSNNQIYPFLFSLDKTLCPGNELIVTKIQVTLPSYMCITMIDFLSDRIFILTWTGL